MAAALRDIPERLADLYGLGRTERDDRRGRRAATYAYDLATRRRHVVYEPGPADPVANLFTAGPAKGGWRESRISGTRPERVPLRLDDADLTAPARYGSLAVVERSLWPQDQIGHLAVATELEFWVRDWADQRGEGCPIPVPDRLCRWLLDRLDWACKHHPALAEFAAKLTQLRNALTATTGGFDPLPTPVDRPCPACGWWALSRTPGDAYIRCGHCAAAPTEDEYRDHLEDVIKTNWKRAGENLADPNTLLWVREDSLYGSDNRPGSVVAGYNDGIHWWSWAGAGPLNVSYWAPIAYPADPGPAKDAPA
jgi:hypothetical protein